MGPIVRYQYIAPQLERRGFARLVPETVSVGLAIFIIGLFKKVVLADGIGPFVNTIYALPAAGEPVTNLDAWAAAFGFQFQIYFDFSGYADMAIGLGKMFNVNLPINFDAPYRAVDRYDLWRRWHITFAQFMRAHVFVLLIRNKLFPVSGIAAMIVTVILAGAWHGIGVTFLLWGLLQGVILLWLHYSRDMRERLRGGKPEIAPRWLRIALCFFVTLLLGTLFRSKDLATAGAIYAAMFDPGAIAASVQDLWGRLFAGGAPLIDHEVQRMELVWIALMAAMVWIAPTTRAIFTDYWTAIDPRRPMPHYAYGLFPALERSIRFRLSAFHGILVAALLVWVFLSIEGTSRFIYYQF